MGEMMGREERRDVGRDLGASHRQQTDFTRGQRRYPIVTANAGRCFVTGARDGHSDHTYTSLLARY